MHKTSIYILIMLYLSINTTCGYNILGIAATQFKSMNRFMTTIFEELVTRGHNVTVITPYPGLASGNYHEIKVDSVNLYDIIGKDDLNSLSSNFFVVTQDKIWKANFELTEICLRSQEVQKLIKSDNQQFDLVISEENIQQANYMFAHKYQVPLILVHTFGHAHYLNNFIGNPLELAISTHEYLSFINPMNLWQKTNNFLSAIWDCTVRPYYIRTQNSIAAKYFDNLPKPLPKVDDLERNASIVFVNADFTIGTSRPLIPNVIEIAGLHIRKPKILPPDLKEIIDNAKDGVIYFSLGSIVNINDLPNDVIKAFLKYFSTLKETVLMKWEHDNLPAKPNNVVIRKWMPQNDILGHPKVKLFISHGGLQSLQETIYHGVPVVGIPVFADHFKNMAKAKLMGYGEQMNIEDLNYDTISSTVQKVLEDENYRTRIKELSSRFKDKPISAMDTFVFWTEYVIRHNGATFMRPPSVSMTWYEYYLVDVGIVLVSIFVLVNINIWIAFKCINRIFFKTAGKEKNKKE